jgi:Replication-relaxation
MLKNNKHRDESERIEIHHPKRENAHDWVVLKQRKLRLPSISKYDHDTAKADLYVALHSLVEDWDIEVPVGGDLVADACFVFRGVRIYIEVDLGNMEPARLFHKIERYIQYARAGEKVIFALRDGRYKAGVIGTELMDYCQERRLGKFVTATLLDNFMEFPQDFVLITPWKERINLEQLIDYPPEP